MLGASAIKATEDLLATSRSARRLLIPSMAMEAKLDAIVQGEASAIILMAPALASPDFSELDASTKLPSCKYVVLVVSVICLKTFSYIWSCYMCAKIEFNYIIYL